MESKIEVDYSLMVAKLAKSGEAIRSGMTSENFTLLGEVLQKGITVGNELDLAKKQVVYGKDLGLHPTTPLLATGQLTASQCHLMHMALGIFGEAGELLEAVYKHVYQGEPLDEENVKEELGDGEFYQQGLRDGLGIIRELILIRNMNKLAKRYKGHEYSDEQAHARADKVEDAPCQSIK